MSVYRTKAAQWLNDNYQDHDTIADLCDAMDAALAQPEAQPVKRATGWVAKRDQYAFPVLFNPYTGEPRDVRDVQSDPQGILIAHPNAHMLAASPPVQAEAQPQRYVSDLPPPHEVIESMQREIDDIKRQLREALPPLPEGLY